MTRWLILLTCLVLIWPCLAAKSYDVSTWMTLLPGSQHKVHNYHTPNMFSDTTPVILDLSKISISASDEAQGQSLVVDVFLGKKDRTPIDVSETFRSCCTGFQCCTMDNNYDPFQTDQMCQTGRFGTNKDNVTAGDQFQVYAVKIDKYEAGKTFPLAGADGSLLPVTTGLIGERFWLMVSNCNANITIHVDGSATLTEKLGYQYVKARPPLLACMWLLASLFLLYAAVAVWAPRILFLNTNDNTSFRGQCNLLCILLWLSTAVAVDDMIYFAIIMSQPGSTHLTLLHMYGWVSAIMQWTKESMCRGLWLWLCAGSPSRSHCISICVFCSVYILASIYGLAIRVYLNNHGLLEWGDEPRLYFAHVARMFLINLVWLVWSIRALGVSNESTLVLCKCRMGSLLVLIILVSTALLIATQAQNIRVAQSDQYYSYSISDWRWARVSSVMVREYFVFFFLAFLAKLLLPATTRSKYDMVVDAEKEAAETESTSVELTVFT